jgi:hypothetical protein
MFISNKLQNITKARGILRSCLEVAESLSVVNIFQAFMDEEDTGKILSRLAAVVKIVSDEKQEQFYDVVEDIKDLLTKDEIDEFELEYGTCVETAEHGDKGREIAKTHLEVDPDFYKKDRLVKHEEGKEVQEENPEDKKQAGYFVDTGEQETGVIGQRRKLRSSDDKLKELDNLHKEIRNLLKKGDDLSFKRSKELQAEADKLMKEIYEIKGIKSAFVIWDKEAKNVCRDSAHRPIKFDSYETAEFWALDEKGSDWFEVRDEKHGLKSASGRDMDKLVALLKRVKAGSISQEGMIFYGFDLRNPLNQNEESITQKLAVKMGLKITEEDMRAALSELGVKAISDLVKAWIDINDRKSTGSAGLEQRRKIKSTQSHEGGDGSYEDSLRQSRKINQSRDAGSRLEYMDYMIEMFGEDAKGLLDSVIRSMSDDEAYAAFDYICQMNDIPNFEEKNNGGEIEQSRKINSDYQGWKNYETWCIALWLDNDQGDQEMVKEWTSQVSNESELADMIKSFVEENNPLNDSSTMYTDLLQSAIDEADYYEIAKKYLDEYGYGVDIVDVDQSRKIKSGISSFDLTHLLEKIGNDPSYVSYAKELTESGDNDYKIVERFADMIRLPFDLSDEDAYKAAEMFMLSYMDYMDEGEQENIKPEFGINQGKKKLKIFDGRNNMFILQWVYTRLRRSPLIKSGDTLADAPADSNWYSTQVSYFKDLVPLIKDLSPDTYFALGKLFFDLFKRKHQIPSFQDFLDEVELQGLLNSYLPQGDFGNKVRSFLGMLPKTFLILQSVKNQFAFFESEKEAKRFLKAKNTRAILFYFKQSGEKYNYVCGRKDVSLLGKNQLKPMFQVAKSKLDVRQLYSIYDKAPQAFNYAPNLLKQLSAFWTKAFNKGEEAFGGDEAGMGQESESAQNEQQEPSFAMKKVLNVGEKIQSKDFDEAVKMMEKNPGIEEVELRTDSGKVKTVRRNGQDYTMSNLNQSVKELVLDTREKIYDGENVLESLDFKIFSGNLDPDIDVYFVSSKYVKVNYDKAFDGAGNNLKYSFIPENHIWLDSGYSENRQELMRALSDLGYPIDHPKVRKFLDTIPLIKK